MEPFPAEKGLDRLQAVTFRLNDLLLKRPWESTSDSEFEIRKRVDQLEGGRIVVTRQFRIAATELLIGCRVSIFDISGSVPHEMEAAWGIQEMDEGEFGIGEVEAALKEVDETG